MTDRYELQGFADDRTKVFIFDTRDRVMLDVLPMDEAVGKLVELNKADRVEKMREKRWVKRVTPKVTVDQIIAWKDAGLTFRQIAPLAEISAPLASVMYAKEMRKRSLQAALAQAPLNDDTLIFSVEHLLSRRTFNALLHPVHGYGPLGTVGAIRRTPDVLLRRTPNIGPKGLTAIRSLFWYSNDYSRRLANPHARLVDYLKREDAA